MCLLWSSCPLCRSVARGRPPYAGDFPRLVPRAWADCCDTRTYALYALTRWVLSGTVPLPVRTGRRDGGNNMRKTIQRSLAVTALTGALVAALSGVASATTILTADPCPTGYKGVIVGSDATGKVFVCQNIA